MNLSSLKAVGALLFFAIVCLVVGLWLRATIAPEWMAADTTQTPPAMRPWAVEADCYSQLARVDRILHGQGLLQNHFTVENWPEGLSPSTTAPFDYVILILYFVAWPFTKHPLDWSGALVSPILWMALAGFWILFRSREFNLTGRALFLAGSALLPAFIWATAFGRPRHQSLIIVLMAMGLTAEYERWQLELAPKRAWNIFAGLVWGFACWTSLFEPAVVLGAIIVFNLVVRRRENFAFLVSFGIVFIAMGLLEGGHIVANFFNLAQLTPEYRAYAFNWLGTIAEVRPLNFTEMISRFSPGLVIVPVLMWFLWPRRNGNKTDALLVLLAVLLTVLTMLQGRWSYYAALTGLFVAVRFCQVAPTHWSRLAVLSFLGLSLLGVDFEEWRESRVAPANQPSLQLAQISRSIDGPGGIMAPWWLSPGLLYFSGQPIVSGSSHCGMTGIVDSAKFFASGSWIEAQRILRERKVRWVVVWDDPTLVYPVLDASRGILGEAPLGDDNRKVAEATVAQVLIEDQDLPSFMHLRGITPQCKLYEYVPDKP